MSVSPSRKQPLPGNAYWMRSDCVGLNSISLKYVVNELTQAASWVHDKFEAGTAAYVLVAVEATAMELHASCATQGINEHGFNSSAVDVDAVTEESFFEH